MNIVSRISDLFMKSQEINSCDNFHFFKSKYLVLNTSVYSDCAERLASIIHEVLNNDLEVEIEFQFQHYDTINILISHNHCASIESIRENLDNALKFNEDDDIHMCITIHKEHALKIGNKLHIFNFSDFIKNEFGSDVFGLLSNLNKFNLNKELIFNVWDSNIDSFGTKTIRFVSQLNKIKTTDVCIDRDSYIIKRNKSCHFTNDSQYKFIPEDFYLYGNERIPQDIKNTFNSLLIIFLIIYISDSSEILNDESNLTFINYKVKGYRLITESINFSYINTINHQDLFDIYQWVYDSGNFIDKIGLARNIISIHMIDKSITSISNGTLKSIESGYDIYLKDNVKQYIEIKNKISEFLITQSDRASDITKNMFSTLKTSFWSIITFFVSVFLLKIVTSSSYTGVITVEMLFVTLVFVLFSFLYLFFSFQEVSEEKSRLLNRYDTIKNRYKDLLNEDDLNNIINTEKLKSDDEKYIITRRNRYAGMWIFFNIIITIVVVVLFYLNSFEMQTDNQNITDEHRTELKNPTNSSFDINNHGFEMIIIPKAKEENNQGKDKN